jgi:lipopolysaccharide export system permease protein
MERLIRLLDLFANRGGPIYLILKMLGFLGALPGARDSGCIIHRRPLRDHAASHDSEFDAFRQRFCLQRHPAIVLGVVLTMVSGLIIGCF